MLPYKWRELSGTLLVRETAPYGKQIGNQAIMQLLVAQFPVGEYEVHLHHDNYKGKGLMHRYLIKNGLYSPATRHNIIWRDKNGKKV